MKQLVKLFLALILVTLIVLFISIAVTNKLTFFNGNDSKHVKILNETDFDGQKFKLRNEIWEMMNENVYFKRTSAYYLIEDRLLKIFYVSTSDVYYSFEITIIINNSTRAIVLNNVNIKNHQKWANYELNSLNLKFNLLDYVTASSISSYNDLLDGAGKYDLKIFIKDSNKKKSRTLYPMRLKVKYLRARRNQAKKGSIVCSKCFYLNKDQYKDLLWWIELNKRIGYQKLVFCNNSLIK